jgi:hypothetical protein
VTTTGGTSPFRSRTGNSNKSRTATRSRPPKAVRTSTAGLAVRRRFDEVVVVFPTKESIRRRDGTVLASSLLRPALLGRRTGQLEAAADGEAGAAAHKPTVIYERVNDRWDVAFSLSDPPKRASAAVTAPSSPPAFFAPRFLAAVPVNSLTPDGEAGAAAHKPTVIYERVNDRWDVAFSLSDGQL